MATSILAALAAPGALIFASATPGSASAQDYTSGLLSGRVVNEAGKPVVGAKVQVSSDQGMTRTAATNAEGDFSVPALPVGSYVVRVEAAGFATAEDRTVTLAPGGASYSFALRAGEVSELVITGARRVQDFNRTDTGLAVDVQDLAERVPVGRNMSSIIQLSPGAGFVDASVQTNGTRRNQSLSTLSGSSAAESVYYINGLNVTDQRSFLGYADLPFEAVRSIDVKTGGYSAEYGRATGGVVNIVTRSGSNTFEGGASVYVSPNALRAKRGTAYQPGPNANPGQVIYNQASRSSATDSTLWASGPILKDRLFFFGVLSQRDSEEFRPAISNTSTPAGQIVGTQARISYDDPHWFTKFDLNITDSQRLEATIFSDRTETAYDPYNWTLAAGRGGQRASWVQTSGGLNQAYKYTGVFTDWLTLSALYGQVESIYKDEGLAVSTPRVRDFFNAGVLIGPGVGGAFNIDGRDTRKTYRVDADLYLDFYGRHHLRGGYDREDLSSKALNGTAGGGNYDLEETTVDVTYFANNGTFNAEQSALYLQDSWVVNSRLSLQAGLRWDKYDYKNINGVSYVKIDDQIAPRLGFTFDPTGDATSKIYGSFGRYYLPIATNTSIRASSGEQYYIDTYAITRLANGNPTIGLDGRPVLGAKLGRAYLSPPTAPDYRQVAASNLEPMFEEEFVVGYERQFADGWTAGVRYIDRNLKSTIEDTATGDAVLRYCARTHRTDCAPAARVTEFPYALINPGKSARLFVDVDLDGPKAGEYLDLTAADMGLPAVERRYRALEFTVERPFDGKWGIQGSYTLGKSYGNYEGAVKSDIGQIDTSLTQDFDHDYNTVGAQGYLPNHRRHQLKLYGAYALTDALRIGANLRAESGRKYGCIGYSPNPDDTSGAPSAWYCLDANGQRTLTPRGSKGETDWQTQIDLNLSYQLPLPDRYGALRASVDVFNLLDLDAVTRVVEQGEVQNRKGVRAPFYGQPRSYQAPRTVRFGLSYVF